MALMPELRQMRHTETAAATIALAFLVSGCTLTTRVVDETPRVAQSDVSTTKEALQTSLNASAPNAASNDQAAIPDYRTASSPVGKARVYRTHAQLASQPVVPAIVESAEAPTQDAGAGATAGGVVTGTLPGADLLAVAEAPSGEPVISVRSSAPKVASIPMDGLFAVAATGKEVFNDVVAVHAQEIWAAGSIAVVAFAWVYARRRRKRKWWFHGQS